MTQDKFRKNGFLKYYCSFSQEEISSMILGVHHLQSMGLWFPFVDHCVAKMDEDMDTFMNEILENFDEDEVPIQ